MKELAKSFDTENLYDIVSERDYNHRDFRFLEI